MRHWTPEELSHIRPQTVADRAKQAVGLLEEDAKNAYIRGDIGTFMQRGELAKAIREVTQMDPPIPEMGAQQFAVFTGFLRSIKEATTAEELAGYSDLVQSSPDLSEASVTFLVFTIRQKLSGM